MTFWDVHGQAGHPVRTTITEMGPLLLARLLELSEAQEGVLNIAFRVADEEGMALLDLKDLQSLLVWVGQNRKALSLRYGNVATASIGAIQRRLLVLEGQGGAQMFGEPALALSDMMLRDAAGRGRINILAADRLMRAPRLYATFLLWLLSELFEELPEVGDPDRPRLVFFFDEAHLLFDDAPKVLVDKVEQVARLIRSKGVGVYFVTQSPDDVPGDVLGQLGNRVQHALRAYTAKDRRALAAAARELPRQPGARYRGRDPRGGDRRGGDLDAGGQGRAGHGRAHADPPARVAAGAAGDAQRAALIAASPLAGKYTRPSSTARAPSRSCRPAPRRRRARPRRRRTRSGGSRRRPSANTAPRGATAGRASAGRLRNACRRASAAGRGAAIRSAPPLPRASPGNWAPSRAAPWCAVFWAGCFAAAEGMSGMSRGRAPIRERPASRPLPGAFAEPCCRARRRGGAAHRIGGAGGLGGRLRRGQLDQEEGPGLRQAVTGACADAVGLGARARLD